ncbi:hypothetical protein EXU57_23245 [Segetibacter sp. 3557_3]|nr:hypothetical protein EXU57_23245 [Segetibacter sp. 3557_3]
MGSKLIEFALLVAQKYDFYNFVAVILEWNKPSMKLLEKHKFKRWGLLPRVADFNGELCAHVYYDINLQNREIEVNKGNLLFTCKY